MVNLATQDRIERKIGRKPTLIFAALLVLTLGLLGYLAHYGKCHAHSRYCVVAVANTRSEVGLTWDTWDLYVSTHEDTQLI